MRAYIEAPFIESRNQQQQMVWHPDLSPLPQVEGYVILNTEGDRCTCLIYSERLTPQKLEAERSIELLGTIKQDPTHRVDRMSRADTDQVLERLPEHLRYEQTLDSYYVRGETRGSTRHTE